MDYKKLINEMTLEEKIGQMLCFAFHGTSYNNQLKTLIEDYNIGNIIHFARNIEDLKQTYMLNMDMHKHAKYPLFIGLDHEGGMVRRVVKDITYLPGAMALNNASEDEMYEIYNAVGCELRLLGFNMNFMPSVDVNNNPNNPVINSRSYSDEPILVAKRGKIAAKAMMDARVLPTPKHFPGHGNTAVDSHVGLPVVDSNLEELENCELIPFKEMIASNVDGMMISHILYKKLDDKLPSSISNKVITKLLKDELGFKGLIITDSLTMSAIWNNYKIRDIVKLGINAGNDIIMFCGKADLNEQKEIINSFICLVKDGEIKEDRINYSVEKILKLKDKYKINIGNNYLDINNINSYFNKKCALAKALTLRSITKVVDENLLPISKNESILSIFPNISIATLVDNLTNNPITIGSILNVDEVIYDENLNNFTKIVQNSKKYDKIILATYNANKDSMGIKIFNSLDKSKVIVVALRSPYDILLMEGIKTYITTFDLSNESVEALCSCMLSNKFSTKLPIKLFK